MRLSKYRGVWGRGDIGRIQKRIHRRKDQHFDSWVAGRREEERCTMGDVGFVQT